MTIAMMTASALAVGLIMALTPVACVLLFYSIGEFQVRRNLQWGVGKESGVGGREAPVVRTNGVFRLWHAKPLPQAPAGSGKGVGRGT